MKHECKTEIKSLENYETDVETLNNELIALKSLVLKGQGFFPMINKGREETKRKN